MEHGLRGSDSADNSQRGSHVNNRTRQLFSCGVTRQENAAKLHDVHIEGVVPLFFGNLTLGRMIARRSKPDEPTAESS
jgi:hypothetical protein